MLEPWEQEIKWGSDSDEDMTDINNNEESWVGEFEEVKKLIYQCDRLFYKHTNGTGRMFINLSLYLCTLF